MTHLKYFGLSLVALSIAACGGKTDAEDNVDTVAQKATEAADEIVAATTEVTSASADRAVSDIKVDTGAKISDIPSGTYTIDKTHGYVTFSYSHLGFSEPVLRFNDVDATIELNAENPAQSTVSATIAAGSIDSAVEKFDSHLNSPDMFDTEQFPEITFASTSLTQTTDSRGTLTGDLTMKGVTLPVTFDVKLLKAGIHPFAKGPAFGVKGTGKLQRSKWGLGYATPNVGDDVTIMIDAEFFGQKPE